VTEDEFHNYAHSAVHELMDQNRQYKEQFRIGGYERWDYDLDKGTLTFSNGGVPYVVAEIQAAGSIALRSNSWMWGWANESLPERVTHLLHSVRQFGEKSGISRLEEGYWEDASEADGWEMANRILGGRGVYRCPDKSGFFFLILMKIQSAVQ
jgi:uncharacterized protein (UPF0128 family)